MSPIALGVYPHHISGSNTPLSLSHFPANRPSSAIDLTDMGTPPTHTLSLDRSDSPSPGGSRRNSQSQDYGDDHRCANVTKQSGNGNGVSHDDQREEGENESDMAVLLRTIDFAAKKHSCQRRKDVDQTPYINHPIAVANFLSTTGISDVRVLQAAVLHDTVEDTHTSIAEIAHHFGQDVARIVNECTDDTTLTGQQRKTEQVRTAPHKSPQAQQVKLADKLHNLESIRRSPPVGWSVRRIQAYFIWAKQVTDICADSHPRLAARLQHLYETAYTRVNGAYYPCHPDVCGPLTDDEKARIDSRLNCLKAGEVLSPKPIFF